MSLETSVEEISLPLDKTTLRTEEKHGIVLAIHF